MGYVVCMIYTTQLYRKVLITLVYTGYWVARRHKALPIGN